MDQDLKKIQEDILAKQSQSQDLTPEVISQGQQHTEGVTLPVIDFQKDDLAPVEQKTEAEVASANAGKMVNKLFDQAIVHVIQTDEATRDEVVGTAKQAIKNKSEALKSQTDREAKASYFSSHEDACNIFGYEEKTTSKFHVKLMAFWVGLLNTIYIATIGFFLVAPITFLCKKLKVVIKQTWLAFIVAFIIYLLIVLTPVLINWLSSISN